MQDDADLAAACNFLEAVLCDGDQVVTEMKQGSKRQRPEPELNFQTHYDMMTKQRLREAGSSLQSLMAALQTHSNKKHRTGHSEADQASNRIGRDTCKAG